MHSGSKKAVLTALFANAGIAVAKFVAFAVTGSSAMLAEGIHSVADTSNQGLLLHGGRASTRAPTRRHPFGFGRERYFWAFVVALVLFSLGGVFALYEGIQKLRDPHEITSPEWAIGVLLIGLALEGFALRTAVREANKMRRGSWIQFIRRSRNPEVPVILLEDLGAIIGLLTALSGVALTTFTGEERWDAAATIVIGTLLVSIAIILAIEMKSLLIGESATVHDEEKIRDAIVSVPAVERIVHMRTQHLGPDELLVGANLVLERGLATQRVAEALADVEGRIRGEVPAARVIYLEPDLGREA